MALVRCEKDGKQGWKWGEENTSCFTYMPGDEEGEAFAKSAAVRQEAAINATE